MLPQELWEPREINLTLTYASAMREFEQKIYSETLTTKDDIKDIWNTINSNNYKGYLRDYWKAEIRFF